MVLDCWCFMIPTCGIFADKLKTMTTFKDSNSGMLEKHPTMLLSILVFSIVSISSKKLQNQAFQECCNKQSTNNAAPLFGIVHGVNGPLKIQNQGFQITPKLEERKCVKNLSTPWCFRINQAHSCYKAV